MVVAEARNRVETYAKDVRLRGYVPMKVYGWASCDTTQEGVQQGEREKKVKMRMHLTI